MRAVTRIVYTCAECGRSKEERVKNPTKFYEVRNYICAECELKMEPKFYYADIASTVEKKKKK